MQPIIFFNRLSYGLIAGLLFMTSLNTYAIDCPPVIKGSESLIYKSTGKSVVIITS